MYKTCSKCRETKPVSDFFKDKRRKDGHHPQCKQCLKKYYTSERGRELMLKRYKKYNKTEKGKETKRKYDQKVRKEYTDKCHAHDAVGWAVRSGKIPRVNTLACVCCGKQAQEYHHHKGYKREYILEVVALCRDCHRAIS